MIYIRKESKEHGTGKVIEGYIKPGSKVLIVDDVATTGISVSKAVEAIRANGGVVENAIALVSRMEGAEENLKKLKVKLTAVITIRDIVNELHKAGLIGVNTLDSVLKQMAAVGEHETD
jgi:orotate phosphoribosyltransferase